MKIIRKVAVKQVVTDDSRQKLYENFISRKKRLDKECQQLLFEQKKMERKQNQSRQQVTNRFEQAIRRRREQMDRIDFRIEQLNELETGAEILEKEVDALVEVKTGMNWEMETEGASIVIQDGIIIRIDE